MKAAILTWLTLKGLLSTNSSADDFSGSYEHLSLQLECIQACSHFVKGALGWRGKAVIAIDVVKTH